MKLKKICTVSILSIAALFLFACTRGGESSSSTPETSGSQTTSMVGSMTGNTSEESHTSNGSDSFVTSNSEGNNTSSNFEISSEESSSSKQISNPNLGLEDNHEGGFQDWEDGKDSKNA